MFIGFARRLIAGALLTGFLSGFGGVTSSGDIEVTGFNLASSADLSRYWAAMDRWHRALFPELPPPSEMMIHYLPILRIAIQSERLWFDPRQSGPRSASVYICNAWDQKWGHQGIIGANLLWRDKLVDQEVAQEIADQLAAGPQEYELFFLYSYWDVSAPRVKEDHIELLPLSDDICLTLQNSRIYSITSTGELLRAVELLRISKEAINAAVGDLPRLTAIR